MNPITVIIPNYNTEPSILQRAIDSAAPQADSVIIYNDASMRVPDGVSLPPNVEMFSLGTLFPLGVCAARNLAIERAESDSLIVPLDADDWLEPGAIEALRFQWEPDKFVYGDWYEHVNRHQPRYVTASPIGMIDRKNVCYAPCMFSVEQWKRVKGYRPVFEVGAEHWAFMYALVTYGYRGVKIDYPVFHYERGKSVRTNRTLHMIDAIKRLIRFEYRGNVGV